MVEGGEGISWNCEIGIVSMYLYNIQAMDTDTMYEDMYTRTQVVIFHMRTYIHLCIHMS